MKAPVERSARVPARRGSRAALALACAVLPLITTAPAAAQTRFVANGAEVTDLRTGLIWRRCAEGQAWTGSDCAGPTTRYAWPDAIAMAQAVAASGQPWRLPNVKELSSIVDLSRVNPAIDLTLFPNTPNAYFWPSTYHARDTSYAWAVLFSDGGLYQTTRSDLNAVRMVRSAP